MYIYIYTFSLLNELSKSEKKWKCDCIQYKREKQRILWILVWSQVKGVIKAI